MDPISYQAAVTAQRRALKPANSIVWIGDSITHQGGRIPVSQSYNSNGFWCWGQVFLGHRFYTLANAGIQGEDSGQILARVPADVIARRPAWCHVLAGRNDANRLALATSKANLTAIYDLCDAAGIRVIAGTVPPTETYPNQAAANDASALNAWIRYQARTRRNIILVDYHKVLSSPSGTGWVSFPTAPQGLTPDGVHPGNGGAPLMGREFADVMAPLVPPVDNLPDNEGDTTSALLFGRFTAGSVGSATPPTGWLESAVTGGPIVYSRTVRTTRPWGSWLTLTVPNGARGVLSNVNTRASSWAVGDAVVGTLRFRRRAVDTSAGLGTSGMSLSLVAVGPNDSRSDLAWSPGTSDNQALWDHEGVMRTPPLTIPAGTTALKLQATYGGGQTIDLDQAAIYNTTTLGIPE